jgi:hypothetical protein
MENETTARACVLVNAGYHHGMHLATPPARQLQLAEWVKSPEEKLGF